MIIGQVQRDFPKIGNSLKITKKWELTMNVRLIEVSDKNKEGWFWQPFDKSGIVSIRQNAGECDYNK